MYQTIISTIEGYIIYYIYICILLYSLVLFIWSFLFITLVHAIRYPPPPPPPGTPPPPPPPRNTSPPPPHPEIKSRVAFNVITPFRGPLYVGPI